MKVLLIFSFLVIGTIISETSAFSWMTCPVSFNPNPVREAELEGPCESNTLSQSSHVTFVNAGDRLKVGWVSNNEGGGWVRLALVPLSERYDANAFDRNVMKVACFGYDERRDRYRDGFCNHPCNARGGCEYQSKKDDLHRYDTTIAIPTNLKDGLYVLQWKAISSGNTRPSYSCTTLHIEGGNNNNIKSPCLPAKLRSPTCMVAPFGVEGTTFLANSLMGAFCYDSNGSSDVDINIGERPVNFMCDPRQSCSIAISPNTCRSVMREPLNPLNPFIQCDQDPPSKEEGEGRVTTSGGKPGEPEKLVVGHKKVVPVDNNPEESQENIKVKAGQLKDLEESKDSLKPNLKVATTKDIVEGEESPEITQKCNSQSSNNNQQNRDLVINQAAAAASKDGNSNSKASFAQEKKAKGMLAMEEVINVNITTVPLPPPIQPSITGGTTSYSSSFTTTVLSTSNSSKTTLTTTSSSVPSTTTTTTTTSTSTSTSITPGGTCLASDSQFFCYDLVRFARCVNNSWVLQSCPDGTECDAGFCVFGLSTFMSSSLTSRTTTRRTTTGRTTTHRTTTRRTTTRRTTTRRTTSTRTSTTSKTTSTSTRPNPTISTKPTRSTFTTRTSSNLTSTNRTPTTRTSTSSGPSSLLSTTSGSTTTSSTSTIVPGKYCTTPDSQFLCYSKTQLARCVFNSWLVQSCAPGTTCLDGQCGWGKDSNSLRGTRLRLRRHNHRRRRHHKISRHAALIPKK